MGKPHPIELRVCVVATVDEGYSHRASALHFRVSPKFVNDMIKLRRATGELGAKPQGNLGRTSKLRGHEDWLQEQMSGARGNLTLDELCVLLERERGLQVHRSTFGHWLHRLGLSHKKLCRPEQTAINRNRLIADRLL